MTRRAALFAALLLALVPAAALARTKAGTSGPDRISVKTPAGQAVSAGGGSDHVRGGDGPDNLLGETGNDTVFGNGGDDRIDGGSGDDKLFGGLGNDTIVAGFGHDELDGAPGDDNLDGGAAPDQISGGDGNDTIHGGTGADDIAGGTGNDTLWADSGPDRIDGGEGDDAIYVNNGTAVEFVDCGPGNDTIFINPYDAPGGISNAKDVREGRIVNCEQVVEQATAEDPTKGVSKDSESRNGVTFTGTERNDNLLGGPGADRLIGLGGDDVIWGNHLHDGPSFGTDTID